MMPGLLELGVIRHGEVGVTQKERVEGIKPRVGCESEGEWVRVKQESESEAPRWV